VERLMEASQAKEKAYKALWLGAPVVPRVRTGVPGGRLISFDDACTECNAETPVAGAAGSGDQRPRHNLVVRQRYGSGVVRKKGNLSIPSDDATPITGAVVSQLIASKLGLPVARLFVQGSDANEKEIELEESGSLDASASVVIVERDENAVQPEREAAAFESCIFRTAAT